MAQLTAQMLIEACADHAFDAGIAIRTELEPLTGPGGTVKPAVYEGGQYQQDRRWRGEGEDRALTDVIVIDNVPSQANRLEAALKAARGELGLPELALDLESLDLPVHLPRRLSSFDLPHRNADAYLRDALLDGQDFRTKTDIGRSIFDASADNPQALFQWMPQALLFGFWQSHLGKKKQQTKLSRSWVSEIVGYDPATTETETLGLKGDPLNLSVDEAVEYDENDLEDWAFAGTAKSGGKKKKESLSEIGHGQVPVAGSPAAISFGSIAQTATVSFASLRRIDTGSADTNAAGRALLASIGLVAHIVAFGRAFNLRSGCDLRPTECQWTWLGEAEDRTVDTPDFETARKLASDCATAAHAAGLPVGPAWQIDPVVLLPQPKLATAVQKTWPETD